MRSLHMDILVGLAFMLVSSALANDEAPTIITPSGRIKGCYKKSQHGRQFESYEGIPYAQPPIGKLRFQPSQAIGPWNGVLDGTKPGPECVQYLIVKENGNSVKGTEDCLYLNVYSPNTPVQSENARPLLPVIFFIHGGSWEYGSGAGQGRPDYVMDKDIVLVTINYRLGPLGFLSTGDNVVPGNMGLKDQVLALQWVQWNIASFGGDPNSITLFGQSAGAASVHFHYLSPMSRGLFHRGVSLSGAALNHWSQTKTAVKKAKQLGAIFGCPTDSSEELVSCLQNQPAQDIMCAVSNFMSWLYNPNHPFEAVAEEGGATPFITKSPVDIINSGEATDLPWITTVVSEEGLYTAAQFVADQKLTQELDENWETIAPYLLDFNYTIPVSEHATVARKIRQHYLGDKPIEKDTIKDVIHLIGDRAYVVDAEKSARIQAKASISPIRMYYFSYRGNYSLADEFTGTNEDFGVCHADDEFYVFPSLAGQVKTKPDRKMNEYMINLWTSFATTGVPDAGIEWIPVDSSLEAIQYLHIAGPVNISMESNANFGEKDFWSSIDFDENKPSENITDIRVFLVS